MRKRQYQKLLKAAKASRKKTQQPLHQYKYLYKKMCEERTIKIAWRNLRRGKSKREAVQKIEQNFEEEVRRMREMILNTRPNGCPVDNPGLAYEPPKERQKKIVNEHGKRRTAHLAEIREQWYFHIIVVVLEPIFMRRIYRYSCASIPGRGSHTGKKYIEKAIKEGKSIRNFLKLDIRHFYDNLRIDFVLREMRKEIADEWFLYCIAKIYKHVKKGILIGLYISPWLANYTLIGLDRIISETPGTVYVRYMDDMVVFANSKKALRKLLVEIRKELGRLRLAVKSNYQVCKFDYDIGKTKTTKSGKVVPVHIGRPLDFMGFLFFRDRTGIRKSIMLSATKTARKLGKQKREQKRFYSKLVRAELSKIGWFTHTDSYDCYLANIKPYVNITKLKKIASKIQKPDNVNTGFRINVMPDVNPGENTALIYTDGSSIGKGKNITGSGWAYKIIHGGKETIRNGSLKCATSNKAEMIAVLKALKAADKAVPTIVYIDNEMTVNVLNEEWKVHKNFDTWRGLKRERDKFHIIRFEWVKGHNKDRHNDDIDRAANMAARKTA